VFLCVVLGAWYFVLPVLRSKVFIFLALSPYSIHTEVPTPSFPPLPRQPWHAAPPQSIPLGQILGLRTVAFLVHPPDYYQADAPRNPSELSQLITKGTFFRSERKFLSLFPSCSIEMVAHPSMDPRPRVPQNSLSLSEHSNSGYFPKYQVEQPLWAQFSADCLGSRLIQFAREIRRAWHSPALFQNLEMI
jgi:hypothetical protein